MYRGSRSRAITPAPILTLSAQGFFNSPAARVDAEQNDSDDEELLLVLAAF